MAKRKPAYQHHKASGQARVRIDGKDHYLGPWGSDESRAEYERLIGAWQARHGETYAIRLGELLAAYLKHAETYYQKNGKVTSEVSAIRTALQFFEPDRQMLAVTFGPRALKRVRERMIEGGIVRTSINKHIGRVRRMFRWAVSEELLPGSIVAPLESVDGLRKGRSKAAESEPVLPVPEEHVDAVQPYVQRPVWGLIQIQRFTGMRPGEALIIRWCDIDTTREVWEYQPESHKTEHHGRHRLICIGQRGQEVLWDFVREDPEEYLFCPSDVRFAVPDAERQPGQRYHRDAYANAIERACKRAGVPHWSPNRLRHNFATEVRAKYGLEAAQVVLGHASAVVTQVYAERDLQKARDVMREMG